MCVHMHVSKRQPSYKKEKIPSSKKGCIHLSISYTLKDKRWTQNLCLSYATGKTNYELIEKILFMI